MNIDIAGMMSVMCLHTDELPVGDHSKPLRFSLSSECGERTCASEPERFCQFLGTMKFGTVAVCLLFRNEVGDLQVLDNSRKDCLGWTLRCPQCLEIARPEPAG